MKRFLVLFTPMFLLFSYSFAQKAMTPVEKKLTDSLCSCVSRLDLSKITNKDEAVAAYTNCINSHLDIVQEFAAERNVDLTNVEQMQTLGIDIAKDLALQKCGAFITLSGLIAQKSISQSSSVASGIFKRIDTKGFNYIVITEGGREQSFLWLRQFPESEKLIAKPLLYTGKKVLIGYHEIEVYLPQAKGYYKIKEVTSLTAQ